MFIAVSVLLLSAGCSSPHQWGCFRCRLNAHRQMRWVHSTQTHRVRQQGYRIILSMCLSVFLTHECLSTTPMWANPFQLLSVDRVIVSDMFSGLDWPGLNMLIGYPILLLPCQRCWQHRRLDERDCAFSVCGVTEWWKERKKIKLNMNSGVREDKDLSLTMPHLLTDMHH